MSNHKFLGNWEDSILHFHLISMQLNEENSEVGSSQIQRQVITPFLKIWNDFYYVNLKYTCLPFLSYSAITF